jgi:hypothetical protein
MAETSVVVLLPELGPPIGLGRRRHTAFPLNRHRAV